MIKSEVAMTTIWISKEELEELEVFLCEGITHIENTRPSELSYSTVKTELARDLLELIKK